MLSYVKKIFNSDERRLKHYYKIVDHINALEPKFAKLSDQELREKTAYFKNELASGKTVFDIQAEAFAVVREASKRVLGMRHFDVQLIGGLVLAEGNIAEMPTGEGKTLVASLPSYLRALEGKGVHVITVNEYLARRDRELIGQIHEFLGLTVGLNLPMMETEEKKAAYQADITYGIGSEFGFDYLRDNMVYDVSQRVQRPFHYAIIDEIDSVLIDEAKTPLIIAGKTGVSSELSYLCARIVKTFQRDVDYYYDEETKATNLTEEGIAKIERGFGIDNLYDLEHQTLYHYVIQALRAHVLFQRDVDYIVKDGKVILIDMFTGRPMEGRSLSNGLHQAIEAKEGLELTEENKTQASITIQNYFRLYPILSGMTGTAKTEEKEFQTLYGMDVVQIPTNKPVIRVDEPDRVFLTIDQKYKAVAKEAKRVHATGQPILIGTTSILQSEKVAKYLEAENLPFRLLNAKTIEQEAQLIALAGQKGQITIATNMAGRGTDIMLGEGVAELGGLFVLGTERHESRRIDNQLKGRAGRQGDPGRSQFFISLEDDMFRRFAKEETEKWIKKAKTDENGEILNKDIHEFVDRVQRICEGTNFSIREYNLKLDDVLNDQRTAIYRLRNRILENDRLIPLMIDMLREYVPYEIEQHCPIEMLPEEWNLGELSERLHEIIPFPAVCLSENINDIEDVKNSVQHSLEQYIHYLETMDDAERVLSEIRPSLLSIVDYHWLNHLDAMERLKEGIGLRHYSQEDPIRQYQREGFELFVYTYRQIEADVCRRLAQEVAPKITSS
ncbi:MULTISPECIES: accessory Sec system translocase SecA2 [unclassified Geobacillus]|uniref:accessory Sec system translocase SecA2 n=1 Tax=unclassified Geobacillus TaxID=2642459 RepID=UPI000BE33F5C|nr:MULTISPECIES: accessory Sec system translocase SecA2 [unclassified Geobacillus]PDM39250.1 accessory Sec system translocase SecA2 [Parageobacillus yumthangensis]PUF87846.1 accessory Sec system translocase SecA2 [Geobacillus sp. LYN3]RDV22504.1 accessory Sec system translocase SecA2 [Parageobacillus toebii]TXK88686.1 accessory Sec system translocase SecA2 [Geobacillus sp. AYS3]